MLAEGSEHTSQSCSCKSCLKDISDQPRLGHTDQGPDIERLVQGKHIPSREKRLIEKLVRTRAVYDDVRKQLLSGGNISIFENANLKPRESFKEFDDIERSSAILHLVDLVDKGVVLEPHKLSECCSCCSCRPKGFRHESRHKRRSIGIPTKSHGKRKKSSLQRRNVRFKAEHIKSDPCTCALKFSGLLKRQSKPKRRNTDLEESEGLSEPIDLKKYEMQVLAKKKLHENTRKKSERSSKNIKRSRATLKASIRSELTKSKDRLKVAMRSIKNKSNLMHTVYEKHAPISDRSTVVSHNHFKIRKDSIVKFREILKRRRQLREYECKPVCHPEECEPDDCYKSLKLRKQHKSDFKTEKSKRTQANSGHSLKRCLCPLKLAEKTYLKETGNKAVGGPTNRCFCTAKLHGQKYELERNKIASSPMEDNNLEIQKQDKQIQNVPAKQSIKTMKSRLQRLRKESILDNQKQAKEIQTQYQRHSAEVGTVTKLSKSMYLNPYECEKKVCVPNECDPYECIEKVKKSGRHHDKEEIGKTYPEINESETAGLDTGDFTETNKKDKSHVFEPKISTIHPKTVSKGTLARMKKKQHKTSTKSKITRSSTPMNITSLSEFDQARRSVKLCSSFSLSITFSNSKSNPKVIQDILKPINHKNKIKKSMEDENSPGIEMKRPTLKRCFCTLNLSHKRNQRLNPLNEYTVRQLILDKTMWDKDALNVYHLDTLLPNNNNMSQKCKMNFLDMGSYIQEKNQGHTRRERSLLSCVMDSNVKNNDDLKNRSTYSEACCSQSKRVLNTKLHDDENCFAIKNYENKCIKLEKPLKYSETSCNFSISRSDLTGVSRLLKPCFCTMNISMPNNNLLHHKLEPFRCERNKHELESQNCQNVLKELSARSVKKEHLSKINLPSDKRIVNIRSELSFKMEISQDNLPSFRCQTHHSKPKIQERQVRRCKLKPNTTQRVCWCPLRLQNIGKEETHTHQNINKSTTVVHFKKKVLKTKDAGRCHSKHLLALRDYQCAPRINPSTKHFQTEKPDGKLNHSKTNFVAYSISNRKSKICQNENKLQFLQCLPYHTIKNTLKTPLEHEVIRVGSSLSLSLGFSKEKSHTLQSYSIESRSREWNDQNCRDSNILMKNFVEKIYDPSSHINFLYSKLHSSEKNVSRRKSDQLQGSAITSQSFLKRCMSALKSKNYKPPDMNIQIRNNKLNREIITYHIQEQRGPKLLPYECEPGICIPGECDPLVCEQIIKRRNMKIGTKKAGPDKQKTKSTSSNHNLQKSTKGIGNQKKSESKKAKQQTYQESEKIDRGKQSEKKEEIYHPEGGRAVKIESNINISIEFSKRGGQKPSTNQNVMQESKPTKIDKNVMQTKTDKKLDQNVMKTSKPTITVDQPKLSRHTSPDELQTEHRRIGTELKRCFCTLKYNLAPATPKQGIDKGLTVHKHGRGLDKVRPQKIEITNTRDTRQQTKLPYKLEPYECEPNVCIPGECDPYECLKRINRRNMNYRTYGTTTKPQETKSASSMAYSNADARCRMTQCSCCKAKCANRCIQCEPPGTQKQIEGTNRAVKISSNLQFSIEFSKGGFPGQQEPQKITPAEVPIDVKPPPEVRQKSTKKSVTASKKSKVSGMSLQTDSVKLESRSSGVGTSLKRCFCTLKLQKVGKQNQINKIKNENEVTSRSVKINTKPRGSSKKQKTQETDLRIGPYMLQPQEVNDRTTMTKKQPTYKLEPYECEPGVCIPGECDPYECYERIKRRETRATGTEIIKRNAANYCDNVKCKSTGIQASKETEKFSSPCQTNCEDVCNRRPSIESRAVRINSNFNISIEFCKQGGNKVRRRNHSRRVRDTRPKMQEKIVKNVPISKNMESQGESVKYEDKGITAQNALKRCFCTLKLQEAKLRNPDRNERIKQKKSITEVLPGSFATPNRYLFIKDADGTVTSPNKQVGRKGKQKVLVNRVAVEETRRQYHGSSPRHQVELPTKTIINTHEAYDRICQDLESFNRHCHFFNLQKNSRCPLVLNEMETIYPYNPGKFKKRRSKTLIYHYNEELKKNKKSILKIMCKDACRGSRRLTAKQGSPSINSQSKQNVFGWHVSLNRFKRFFSNPKHNSCDVNKVKSNEKNLSVNTKTKESKYGLNILKNIFFNIYRCERNSVKSKGSTFENKTKSLKLNKVPSLSKEELCEEYEHYLCEDTIRNNEFVVLNKTSKGCFNKFNELVCNFCHIQYDKTKNIHTSTVSDIQRKKLMNIYRKSSKEYACNKKVNEKICNQLDKGVREYPEKRNKLKTKTDVTTASKNDVLNLETHTKLLRNNLNTKKIENKFESYSNVFQLPTEPSVVSTWSIWSMCQGQKDVDISNKANTKLTSPLCIQSLIKNSTMSKTPTKPSSGDFCPVNHLSADNRIVNGNHYGPPVLTVGFMKLEDKKGKSTIAPPNQESSCCSCSASCVQCNLWADNKTKKTGVELKKTKIDMPDKQEFGDWYSTTAKEEADPKVKIQATPKDYGLENTAQVSKKVKKNTIISEKAPPVEIQLDKVDKKGKKSTKTGAVAKSCDVCSACQEKRGAISVTELNKKQDTKTSNGKSKAKEIGAWDEKKKAASITKLNVKDEKKKDTKKSIGKSKAKELCPDDEKKGAASITESNVKDKKKKDKKTPIGKSKAKELSPNDEKKGAATITESNVKDKKKKDTKTPIGKSKSKELSACDEKKGAASITKMNEKDKKKKDSEALVCKSKCKEVCTCHEKKRGSISKLNRKEKKGDAKTPIGKSKNREICPCHGKKRAAITKSNVKNKKNYTKTSIGNLSSRELARLCRKKTPSSKFKTKDQKKSGKKTVTARKSKGKKNAKQTPMKIPQFTKLLSDKIESSKKLINQFAEHRRPTLEDTKKQLKKAKKEKNKNIDQTKKELVVEQLRKQLAKEELKKRIRESEAKLELKLNKYCICGSQSCKKKYKHLVTNKNVQAHLLRRWKCSCQSEICDREIEKAKLRSLPREQRKQYAIDLKIKEAARKQERKEIAARTLQYAREERIRTRQLLKRTAQWNKAAKKSVNKPTSVLIGQSLVDLAKLGARASTAIFRFSSRTIKDPKQALSALKKSPLGFVSSIFGDTEAGATFSRIGQRIRAMKEIKSMRASIESTRFGNQLVNLKNPKRRKKVMQRPRRRKAPISYDCNIYMYTIRKKRCLAIYYMCPCFYPHCLNLLHMWKQLTDAILFLLAVCVWSPCILATEFCRAFLCCALCTG